MKDDTLLFVGCLDSTVKIFSIRKDPIKPNVGLDINITDECEVTCLKALDKDLLFCGQTNGYIHLIDTESKTKVGNFQLTYSQEETKADIYDIIPLENKGLYAVATKRGLFIIEMNQNGKKWEFKILHRNFNDRSI